jgi:hypothetical protein
MCPEIVAEIESLAGVVSVERVLVHSQRVVALEVLRVLLALESEDGLLVAEADVSGDRLRELGGSVSGRGRGR